MERNAALTKKMYMIKDKMRINATRKVMVYGSTVLPFQGVIRPSSIDHGRGHLKLKRSLVMWCRYRIRKKNSQAKPLTFHFNRLKPYFQPEGTPTDENIGCKQEQWNQERRDDPVNEENYLDEDMFIIT